MSLPSRNEFEELKKQVEGISHIRAILSGNFDSYRLFQLRLRFDVTLSFKQRLKYLWGYDVWFNNVPFFKCLLAANILIWLLFFLTQS